MSSQFHNRLVGTVVLMALGVIFLPDILDGKKEHQQEQFTEIPLRPQTDVVTSDAANNKVLDEPKSAPAVVEQTVVDESPKIAPSQTAAVVETKVTQTENSVPKDAQPAPEVQKQPQPQPKKATQVSWTIQLGAFSNAANVKGLVQRLRSSGYAAYTLPDKPVDGKLTRVFVGPEISLDRLKEQQGKIEAQTKLKGKIIQFNPLER
ncbi:SPOR domain-containing protein [Shewanella yunxiaonensis]|uniref:SPOR domain-containing protein n=1 Tax=Shewanella yunxiaonensis TaxID=2829809 RepID=A0ABX7YY57_9GAMM|nr:MULTISPECIES: SPOR domain-containing protein [Shewanella]MDF0535421.1 SPOR domain-containing protein [Shewanella sp. A32]QUN07204.1 SPOR domain-containing protein [Shewanella yunxiaonensis]